MSVDIVEFFTENVQHVATGLLAIIAVLGVFQETIRDRVGRLRATRAVRKSEAELGSIGAEEDPSRYVGTMERKGRAKVQRGDHLGVYELEEVAVQRTLDNETLKILIQTLAAHSPTDQVFKDILKLLCSSQVPGLIRLR